MLDYAYRGELSASGDVADGLASVLGLAYELRMRDLAHVCEARLISYVRTSPLTTETLITLLEVASRAREHGPPGNNWVLQHGLFGEVLHLVERFDIEPFPDFSAK